MALLDNMRMRLRLTTDATDEEIEDEINAAIYDMRRCGVKEALLNMEHPNPLVKHAIAAYVHAHYGMDNSEREQFIASYERTLCDLLNSKANEYLFPVEETVDDGSSGDDSGDTGDDDGASGDDGGGG